MCLRLDHHQNAAAPIRISHNPTLPSAIQRHGVCAAAAGVVAVLAGSEAVLTTAGAEAAAD
jgi:hypothetical protein